MASDPHAWTYGYAVTIGDADWSVARTVAGVDVMGLADTASAQMTSTVSPTRAVIDTLGLTDGGQQTSVDVIETVTDTLGLTDGGQQTSVDVIEAIADTLGLTDGEAHPHT